MRYWRLYYTPQSSMLSMALNVGIALAAALAVAWADALHRIDTLDAVANPASMTTTWPMERIDTATGCDHYSCDR